jgi:hypothetical protein
MSILQQSIMDQLLRENTVLFEEDELTDRVCEAVCGLHNLGLARYNAVDSSLTLNEDRLMEYLA